jgi:hypothetical protein
MGAHYALPIALPAKSPAMTAPGRPANERNGGGEPVSRLRGAGVQIDGRKAGRVLAGLVLGTLAILVVVFTVVGFDKNRQIDELHSRGVPVTVTVTGCLGLLGGSGSNAAGYSCHGTYALDGHTYDENLPGNSFHRPGTTVAAVAVPGDPALVSPRSTVESEQASGDVFAVPAVLLAVLLLSVCGLLLRQRHRRQGAGGVSPPGRN